MHIEIALKPSSSISPSEMRSVINRISSSNKSLFSSSSSLIPSSIPFPAPNYASSIESIKIEGSGSPLIHCFTLNDRKSAEDIIENEGDPISLSTKTILPAKKFNYLWESIVLDDSNQIKTSLLNFLSTAISFSERSVSSHIVACNRLILLYGPPGTGKTSLCQGLAQKLSIRFSYKFSYGVLLEINTHSIFSKWFAESGKMVKKLFDRIHDAASDESALVFVLIDEVESIATARQSAINGSDPSDAIRVVNALLTQIDKLREKTNIIIMATSNLTHCIDLAFLSRADIKQLIGDPPRKARYSILKECLLELMQKGVITPDGMIPDFDNYIMIGEKSYPKAKMLMKVVDASDGLSGRTLRKLPFLASVHHPMNIPSDLDSYLKALLDVTVRESKVLKEE
jgi:Cdc6-like AAA superfamily ATPase